MTSRTAGLLTALALAAAPACSSETDGATDDLPVDDRADEVNVYLLGLPELVLADYVPKTPVECEDDECVDQQEDELFCTYSRFTETAHYSEFISFQPNSAALWPGSVVQGADAQEGFFTPVGVSRAPLTFSVSLENLSGKPVGRLENPSLSEFREVRNSILAQGTTGATPAAIDFEVTEVHSQSQISLALGASVLWPGGTSVSAGFNFDSSSKKTKILVNYTQAYYTIDIDTPIEPADFFGSDVTVDELQQFTSGDNPPLYVQSITYGRRVIFSVESNESADKVKAALQAAYEAGFEVDVDLEANYERTLRESTIRAFVLGGSGAEAAQAIAGFEGLVDYISKGGDYSKESPGAPIAYKLAYLDNAVTKFAFTTDYTERDCVTNRGTLRGDLMGIDHVGGGDNGNLELYGWVGVRFPTADNPVIDCETGGDVEYLLNLGSDQYISMEEHSTWAPPAGSGFARANIPMGEGEKLCVFAEMYESDTFSDDDFGATARIVEFEVGWGGDHVLHTQGSGENALDVRLRLTVE